MTHNPSELISETRRLVDNLQNSVRQILIIEPRLRENPQLTEKIESVTASLADASGRLAQPALRIAMIGTTSAGKSTLVNALIGRQVAPIDADEMSAGILHLVHAERTRLVINGAENACWQAVDQYDWHDDDVYNHLKENVFKPYHSERQKRTIPIPQIRVEGPLLPMNWPGLFALPPESGLEIYDLPGLNSVQDSENLKVIQSQLKSCFSLVLLDYSHTDRKSREKLFNEIKEVVDVLGGVTDTLLFAVNRVDRRTKKDEPLLERLETLSKEIQQKLGLPTNPELIPVKALPLFYGQVAWGTTVPMNDMEPTTQPDQQLSCFKDFVDDCTTIIPKSSLDWFLQRYELENFPIEDLREWVKWTWQWSEGEILLGKFKERIEDKFAEVIIAPILMKPLSEVVALQEMLASYCEMQRTESTEQLRQTRDTLEQTFTDIRNTVEKKGFSFLEKMGGLLKLLLIDKDSFEPEDNSDESRIEKFRQELQQSMELAAGHVGHIGKIRRTVSKTRRQLIKDILLPISDFYEMKVDFNELRHILIQIPSTERENLCKWVEAYRVAVLKDEKTIKYGFTLKEEITNETGLTEMEKMEIKERKAKALYLAVRNALRVRANYLLQTQASEIERLLSQILEEEVLELKRIFDIQLPEYSAILTAMVMDQYVNDQQINLPDELFAFDATPESQHKTVFEKIDTETYDEGSCFKSKKQRPVYDNVEYKTLELPSLQGMMDQWKTGIQNAEDQLWQHFGAWFAEIIKHQINITTSATDKAGVYLMKIFDDRLNQSRVEYEQRLSGIDDLFSVTKSMMDHVDKLKKLQISEN